MSVSPLRWYREVVRRYAPEHRRPYEYPVNRFYAHRVDPILTWVADLAGLSPNQVTVLSLLAGLAAAAAIIGGWYVAAALLIQLHHLLDGVDGNLARHHRLCSEFGRRLDIATDQAVRFAVFVSLAAVASVPPALAVAMVATLYIDLLVVTTVVTPFAGRHTLVRSRWKQWFLDRGLLPGFDIFTIYLVVSVCLLLSAPEAAVWLTAGLKTVDWAYRLWECEKTLRHERRGRRPA